jgi:hypothetical protein
LLAKPTQLNINLSSDRFAMFNKQRDITQDRCVEVIDAGGDRACNGALLIERIAANHQSTDRSAAEAQHRKVHSGAPEHSHVH